MLEPRERYSFLAAPPVIIHYREYPGIFVLCTETLLYCNNKNANNITA